MIYFCYYCEFLQKNEFIEKWENVSLNRIVMEAFPEGLLIYEKLSKKVLLANKNIVRLISQGIKYQ